MTVEVLRAFDAYVEDLSNWYVRRSRRRFWDGDQGALRALWYALVTALRVVAPIVPFLTEHLWQSLVRDVVADAPTSIFLAGWPADVAPEAEVLSDMALVRRVVELGRQARVASRMRVRQPLRQLVVEGADGAAAYTDEIADELRVKSVAFGELNATELRVRPNLPVLGPRLGSGLGAIRKALDAGEFDQLPDGGFRVAGHELSADDVLVERTEKTGWAVAGSDGVSVGLDLELDDDLRLEGRLNDAIHHVNTRRKEAGFEVTDRIHLTVPAADADLLRHAERLAAETLAVSVDASENDEYGLTLAVQ